MKGEETHLDPRIYALDYFVENLDGQVTMIVSEGLRSSDAYFTIIPLDPSVESWEVTVTVQEEHDTEFAWHEDEKRLMILCSENSRIVLLCVVSYSLLFSLLFLKIMEGYQKQGDLLATRMGR